MAMSAAAGHADVAAEAIRALNHATLPGRAGLREPAEAYEILTHLGFLADRLGQAIRQVQHYLDEQNSLGGIRIVDGDHRDNPTAAVTACRTLNERAAAAASALAEALHAAQETLTWAAANYPKRGDTHDWHREWLERDDPGRPPLTR